MLKLGVHCGIKNLESLLRKKDLKLRGGKLCHFTFSFVVALWPNDKSILQHIYVTNFPFSSYLNLLTLFMLICFLLIVLKTVIFKLLSLKKDISFL